jgi:metal-responsive CopG/Arc/MetJ family transcriptional regulator
MVVQMADSPNSTSLPKSERSPRLSVTIPVETYDSLERIARKKKVSLAWVVRDAAERYVSDELPLFREIGNA